MVLSGRKAKVDHTTELGSRGDIAMVSSIALASAWNSLEVVKLLVGLLTPLVVLLLGVWVNRLATRLDHAEWTNQKVVEKRLIIYDDMAPSLNAIYCYFLRIGAWNEHKPADIIALKRATDATVGVYRYLFTSVFWEAYQRYMGSCFETYTGPGRPARLRTSPEGRIAETCPAGSEEFFSPGPRQSSTEVVARDYDALMGQFARELGIGLKDDAEPASNISAVPPSPQGVAESGALSLPARRLSDTGTTDLASDSEPAGRAQARRPPP